MWKCSPPSGSLSVFDHIHRDETVLKSERSWTKAGPHPHVSKPKSDFKGEVMETPFRQSHVIQTAGGAFWWREICGATWLPVVPCSDLSLLICKMGVHWKKSLTEGLLSTSLSRHVHHVHETVGVWSDGADTRVRGDRPGAVNKRFISGTDDFQENPARRPGRPGSTLHPRGCWGRQIWLVPRSLPRTK